MSEIPDLQIDNPEAGIGPTEAADDLLRRRTKEQRPIPVIVWLLLGSLIAAIYFVFLCIPTAPR